MRAQTVLRIASAALLALTFATAPGTAADAADLRRGSITSRGMNLDEPTQLVPDLPGVGLRPVNSVLASGAAPVSVVATAWSGAQAFLNVPIGSLPEGSMLHAAAVANESALQVAAPPPAGTTIVAGFHVYARTASGTLITGNLAPVKAVFTLPASSFPAGTSPSRVVLASWTGTSWTTLATTVAENVNQNGSVTLTTSLSRFALFSVWAEAADPPQFGGSAIAPSGVSLVSFTGTTAQLDAAGAAARAVSVSATASGRLLTFVVGAPAFVNADFIAAFPGGLNATPVIVRT